LHQYLTEVETTIKQKSHPEEPGSKDAADHTLDAEATFNKASFCATAGAQRTTRNT